MKGEETQWSTPTRIERGLAVVAGVAVSAWGVCASRGDAAASTWRALRARPGRSDTRSGHSPGAAKIAVTDGGSDFPDPGDSEETAFIWGHTQDAPNEDGEDADEPDANEPGANEPDAVEDADELDTGEVADELDADELDTGEVADELDADELDTGEVADELDADEPDTDELDTGEGVDELDSDEPYSDGSDVDGRDAVGHVAVGRDAKGRGADGGVTEGRGYGRSANGRDVDGRGADESPAAEVEAIQARLDDLAETADHLTILATNANLKLARDEPRDLAGIAYDVEAEARGLRRAIEAVESHVDRLRDRFPDSPSDRARSAEHERAARARPQAASADRTTGGRPSVQSPGRDRTLSGPWRTAGVDLTNWPGHLAHLDFEQIQEQVTRSETIAAGQVPSDVAEYSLDDRELSFEALLSLPTASGLGQPASDLGEEQSDER